MSLKVEKSSARKAKAHTIYKNKKGERVPGCTTVLGVAAKPALVGWANKLGLQGIVSSTYVDDLAQIGTLGHHLIECHILSQLKERKIKPELDDNSKNQLDAAKICYKKFISWEKKQKSIKYIASEMDLISEKHQYGGKIDIYVLLNGLYTLLDIKTSKAVYADHYTQVGGGYRTLLLENKHKVDDVRIIRVGRTNEEGTEAEDMQVPNILLHEKRFLACKKLYDINKVLKIR